MRSVYNFVVKPKGGRYNNKKKVADGELILNTEIFNHQYINKTAIIVSTPIIIETDLKPGDEVIVHHNVFRRWHNVRGEEKNSRSYFDENTYIINQDQIFLVKYCKSFSDSNWYAPKGYCFIEPLKDNDKFSIDKEKQFIGIVRYSDGTVNVGDIIGYQPKTQSEFMVDGNRLYRVLSNLITIKYEHQGDEETYNPSWAQSS
jgi:hypothetical protein